MNISFQKYQGTGNDFVMIDQRRRQHLSRKDQEVIEWLCDRRFGIGADGLILLQPLSGFDFEMVYFNSDGRESSMCGNGGRCVVAFAHHLGVIADRCHFLAIDGPHEASIVNGDWVELRMNDVTKIENGEGHSILNTGSPHFVSFVEDLDDINVAETGAQIRYSSRFREKGINVNFVEEASGQLKVATYERGVEAETLSCGTGVTAAALAWYKRNSPSGKKVVDIRAKGGELQVRFEPTADGGFTNIWLCGPAKKVFKGTIELP